jgi:Trypsin
VYVVLNHPYFSPYTYNFDYALLRLATFITFDGITKAPIALPDLNEEVSDGTPVLVSGWGLTKSLTESRQFLRGVVLPTINQTKCDTIYKYDGGISKQMICAGSPGRDSCNVRHFFLLVKKALQINF